MHEPVLEDVWELAQQRGLEVHLRQGTVSRPAQGMQVHQGRSSGSRGLEYGLLRSYSQVLRGTC